MRVTSLELHQKLGQTIDRARLEPVIVTKHDRDHVVILSAEQYAALQQGVRHARLSGSLSIGERALAAAATVPSKQEQKRYIDASAAALRVKAKERSDP
jgi:prevent-host-death family protein